MDAASKIHVGKYRPEIDGLRAVAVIPVLLFHAGIAGFRGGYAGVDVFFVISGFLITQILIGDLSRGTFSIRRFYERRARRILPALAVVIIACLPAAWLLMSAAELMGFGKSLIAVALFSSNILFWRDSGYFDLNNELKPMLHTWSLGVEEQFYLIYPLALAMIWRFRRNTVAVLVTVVALVSLVAADWASRHMPVAAFYLLPTRTWELMLGAIGAIVMRSEAPEASRSRRAIGEGLGILGIGMIVFAVARFDETTPFPGWPALIPTVGTLLVLVFAERGTLVARLLSVRPIVMVGLISYSAYLWHQPLLVFARIGAMTPPAPWVMAAMAGLSLPLAWITWRWVEVPIRTRQSFNGWRLATAVVAASGVWVAVGAWAIASRGMPRRFDLPATVATSLQQDSAYMPCFDRKQVHERSDWTCALGARDTAPPAFFLLGDSHSLAMVPGVDSAARALHVNGVYTAASGCLPFIGIFALRADQAIRNCHQLNERVLAYVKERRIPTVMLVARWTYYTDGGYSHDDLSYVGLSDASAKQRDSSRAAFRRGLEETIRAYAAAGVRRLVIVKQVPQQLGDPNGIYQRSFRRVMNERQPALDGASVSLGAHHQLQAFVDSAFSAARVASVELVDLDGLFCDTHRCRIGTTERSWYVDDDHLSLPGALRAVPTLLDALRPDGLSPAGRQIASSHQQ